MDKYVIVTQPESYDFIGRENCHLIDDDEGYIKYVSSVYFVREDIYEKVMNLSHTPNYDNYDYGTDPY